MIRKRKAESLEQTSNENEKGNLLNSYVTSNFSINENDHQIVMGRTNFIMSGLKAK